MNNAWSSVDSIAPLTDVQAAWLAALIDGEGTIGVWRERRPKNKSGWRYKAVLRVFNTNIDLLLRVRELTGCTIGVKDRRTKYGKHYKVLYHAIIQASRIPAILEQVRPYLIAKRRQADMVIQFCRAVADAPMRASGDHEVFEHFYLELRALNQRGTSGG